MKRNICYSFTIVFFVALILIISCSGDGYPISEKDANISNATSIDYEDIDIETLERSYAYSGLKVNGQVIAYELLGMLLPEDFGPELVLPATYNGLPVISLGDYAASGWSYVEKIVVPDSYKYIAYGAFADSPSLKEVILPDYVKYLGDYSFSNCPELEKVNIPSNLTEIPQYVFQGCKSLNNVIIPDSVIEIGVGAFNNCSSLDQIVIPESVTRIERWSFSGCPFENIDFLPSTIEYIGNSAFQNGEISPTIRELRFPKSLKRIEDYSFQRFPVLESLELHSGIEEIGGFCFMDCGSLKTFAIRLNEENNLKLKLINDKSFIGCSNLEKITIVYNPVDTQEEYDTLVESISEQFKVLLETTKGHSNLSQGWDSTTGLEGINLEFVSSSVYDNF